MILPFQFSHYEKNIIKYAIGLCFLSFLTFLIPSHSEAFHTYEVSIQFSFDTESPDIPDVYGYRLYKDGVEFCVERKCDRISSIDLYC